MELSALRSLKDSVRRRNAEEKLMIELLEKLTNEQKGRIVKLEEELEVQKEAAALNAKEKEAIKELENMKEEVDSLNDMIEILIVKERRTNDELVDARKEMIKILSDNQSNTIGLKRLGELDPQPFLAAAERIYCSKGTFNEEYAHLKGMESCSFWEKNLRDPNWYPFKLNTKENGEIEEIVDESDLKLKRLYLLHDNRIYKAVVQALTEIKEYNASGVYAVQEIWNFTENKKATLKEAISFIADKFDHHSNKKLKTK